MCRRFLCLMVLIALSFCGYGQAKSSKRGIAYGHHVPKDLEALSEGVSWWYNWYHQPEETVANVYDDYDFNYVPMAWTSSFNKTAMRDFLLTHPDVDYILGWNEPNFLEQANLTPSQAAANWPAIEALADEFDLKIVGPAVNYCGGCVSEDGVTYGDPIKYLDAFFAACPDCRVDYIGIHSYMANVGALQWYVGLFKKYGKPIWLTEFAAWEGTVTLQNQKDYMIGAVDYLESDPDVFRYAWFTGRFTGAPYIGILDAPGVLTELGQIYTQMPLHDANAHHLIPARIEAETYNTSQGILLQSTADVSGFANVGYIDANDWLDYGLDVPESGTYYVYFRLASTKETSLQLMIGEEVLETLAIENTNGWQTWKTFMIPLTLNAGQQMLRVKSIGGGFNMNWIQFDDELIMSNEKEQQEFTVYPNPTSEKIFIPTPSRFTAIEMMDVFGKRIYNHSPEEYIDVKDYSPGTYIIRFIPKKGMPFNKKIIKR